MAAGTRVGGDGYCSAASIEIVVRCGQPEAFKSFFEFPFLADAFLHADPELHKIPATHLIGETELVVTGRIELVKSVPVPACRIFRSRGVVTLDKDAWRRDRFRKRLAHAGITRPCADGRCAERTLLSIKLGVVVEIRRQRALHVQPDGDFIEVPAAHCFGKTKVPRRKAPENIRLEGRTRNDVMETSVNSVEIVTRNCAV